MFFAENFLHCAWLLFQLLLSSADFCIFSVSSVQAGQSHGLCLRDPAQSTLGCSREKLCQLSIMVVLTASLTLGTSPGQAMDPALPKKLPCSPRDRDRCGCAIAWGPRG